MWLNIFRNFHDYYDGLRPSFRCSGNNDVIRGFGRDPDSNFRGLQKFNVLAKTPGRSSGINILKATFMLADPKSAKRHWRLDYLFALLVSACVKVAFKHVGEIDPRCCPLLYPRERSRPSLDYSRLQTETLRMKASRTIAAQMSRRHPDWLSRRHVEVKMI